MTWRNPRPTSHATHVTRSSSARSSSPPGRGGARNRPATTVFAAGPLDLHRAGHQRGTVSGPAGPGARTYVPAPQTAASCRRSRSSWTAVHSRQTWSAWRPAPGRAGGVVVVGAALGALLSPGPGAPGRRRADPWRRRPARRPSRWPPRATREHCTEPVAAATASLSRHRRRSHHRRLPNRGSPDLHGRRGDTLGAIAAKFGPRARARAAQRDREPEPYSRRRGVEASLTSRGGGGADVSAGTLGSTRWLAPSDWLTVHRSAGMANLRAGGP